MAEDEGTTTEEETTDEEEPEDSLDTILSGEEPLEEVAEKIEEAPTEEAAAEAALQGAMPLRENGYKLQVIKALVRRNVLGAAGRSGELR